MSLSSSRFLIAVILLVGLAGYVASLKCFHCVCQEDCEKNPDLERSCPSEMNACLTQKGPSQQFAKACAKHDKPETVKGSGGQELIYCSTDKCNSQIIKKTGDSAFIPNGNVIMILAIAATAFVVTS